MKQLIFAVFFLSLPLYAVNLEYIIQQALQNNPSLAAIEQRIQVNKSAIDIADQFANPLLSLTTDTLDTQEKMHKQTLTLQQKLPYFGKLDAKLKVANAQEGVLKSRLIRAQVKLVNALKEQAYYIWELEQLLTIIKEYEDVTKQNIELSESYTSSAKNQHMGIMSAQLSLTDLQIQRSSLEAKITQAYAQLSYLSAFSVQKLEMHLSIDTMPTKEQLQSALFGNPELQLKDKEIEKNRAMIETAKLENYPDINLVGGYSYRNNYDDYFTLGFGISLPIYGTEKYQEEAQRKAVLVTQSQKKDVDLKIASAFRAIYSQMQSEYEIYHLIHDEALPQIAHMFELTNTSISTGGDLFKYIDILEQKLRLEQKSIHAVSAFHRAYAKILALQGKLQ